jgi:putative DNA primase/helicase
MLIDVALAHVRYGLPIVALRPRDKAPAESGWQRLDLDEAAVKAYWSKHPTANVGLRCGATGWVAIDLDGDEWLQWALATLPHTPLRTLSGSGQGGHLIYRWPVGVPVAKRKLSVPGLPDSRLHKGVVHKGADLYGDGVQVVLPGSVHPSGGLYRWAHGDGPMPPAESVPVFDLAWLPASTSAHASLSLPAQADAGYRRAQAWIAKRDPAVQGQRGDEWTYVTACELVHGFGLSDADALALLAAWNATCLPPWSSGDLAAKVKSARRSGQGAVKPARPMETTDREALRTGAAEWRAESAVPAKVLTSTSSQSSAKLVFPVKVKGRPVPDHSHNTRALLDFYGVQVAYDLMRHALVVTCPTFAPNAERAANATIKWVENRAADHGLARTPIYSHLTELAREHHPVLDWIAAKPWDGEDRVQPLLSTLHLAADCREPEFRRDLVYRWLLGAAASILPEFEGRFAAQGVLVLQGAQGRHKTRWFRSLAPAGSDWLLTGRRLDPSSRDSVQAATSVWLVELGEIDATFRKADVAALKAFVTQERDTYRSAYDRREEQICRRTVFLASVNEPEYLVDTTGNRRWWTVPVDRCDADHGIDVQQLWAELVALARLPSARWWLDDAESAQLAGLNADHEPDDAIASEVRDTWRPVSLFDSANPPRGASLAEVCRALVTFERRAPSPQETHRIVQALRDMGVRSHRNNRGRVYWCERVPGSETSRPTRSESWYA